MLVRRTAAAAAVLAAAVPALAGCGGSTASSGQQHSGAKVFARAGCGTCHTLAQAGTTGTVGPDLDQVRPRVPQVVRQVTVGGAAMPSFRGRLSGSQISAVARFVASATRTATLGRSVAAAFEPDSTAVADCSPEDFRCFEQAFANIAYRRGPKAALDRLDRSIRSPGPIWSDCHRIVHAIGAGSLAHFRGDIGLAFAHGRASCAAGYYHGILERAFLGVPPGRIAARARSICSGRAIRRLEFIRYQCVHGLGHGLMIYTGYDLPRSLRICDRLNGVWAERACTGGVFMENLASSYGVTSPWLEKNDLLYPCDAVARRYKHYCYLIVTARILPAVNYRFAKAAAVCRRSEPDWVSVCFQSLGRDASGFTRLDVPRTLRICEHARDMLRECLIGASRDMAYTDASPRRAKVLCNAAPPRARAYCWRGIGTILGGLHATDAGRRAACARATHAFARACDEGASLSVVGLPR